MEVFRVKEDSWCW